MKKGIAKDIVCLVAGVWSLLVLSSTLQAQGVAQTVLDDIVITKSGFTGVIKIKYRVPMRYISHNPEQIGKEIRIKVDFVSSGASRAVRSGFSNGSNTGRPGSGNNRGGFGGGIGSEADQNQNQDVYLRESLVPRYKYSFGLEEVSYETVLRENYLTLYFKSNVSFEIVQDPSYRSLSIVIHDVIKE
ncbi:hypothetical protein MNBD_GAMMA09-1630 [hydrothermal vent metagenome]|uniref:Uncharacterized protein n=1 Tax=hydrothermal vent metagenome TaxID=652676 RepID=A0A3B0YK63_9ZZZZ